jgi:hypothetical protein
VTSTFATIQSKHEYRLILQRKIIRDGVFVLSRRSTSLVDVHRAIHQVKVASRTLADFSNATVVQECVASLNMYMGELYDQSKAIQDAPEQPTELEESPEFEAITNGVDETLQRLHGSRFLSMPLRMPSQHIGKVHQSLHEWEARSQRHAREKRRLLLGSLPAEVIHGYVTEQRLVSLFPSQWRRWLYALLLQQNRTPKLASLNAQQHAKSSFAVQLLSFLKVLLCGVYYIFATSFVIAFHLRQHSPNDVNANKTLYASAVSNTVLEMILVSPVWLLLQLAILPMLAKLVLRRELQNALSGLDDASTQTGSGKADKAISARGLLGVSKAKNKLLDLHRNRSTNSALIEPADDGSIELPSAFTATVNSDDRGVAESKVDGDRNHMGANHGTLNETAAPG